MKSTTKARASHSLCFIDGPNIDAVLGLCVLQRRPLPGERPRWDRVHDECLAWFGAGRPHFVLNGNRFTTGAVFSFRRSLRGIGYDAPCPRGNDGDPVDRFIVQAIQASLPLVRAARISGIVLFAHDHGYAEVLREVLEAGGSVTVIGFREELAPALLALESDGAKLLDLEYDLDAFNVSLNRPYQPSGQAA